MIMVGYDLGDPSGTYEFHIPNTNSVVFNNLVVYTYFIRWETKV